MRRQEPVHRRLRGREAQEQAAEAQQEAAARVAARVAAPKPAAQDVTVSAATTDAAVLVAGAPLRLAGSTRCRVSSELLCCSARRLRLLAYCHQRRLCCLLARRLLACRRTASLQLCLCRSPEGYALVVQRLHRPLMALALAWCASGCQCRRLRLEIHGTHHRCARCGGCHGPRCRHATAK
jgi:hypothetical protein